MRSQPPLDENGRPILVPGMEPSPEGTVVAPAITGGSNWWSPTYSPSTDLIYVMAYDAGPLAMARHSTPETA